MGLPRVDLNSPSLMQSRSMWQCTSGILVKGTALRGGRERCVGGGPLSDDDDEKQSGVGEEARGSMESVQIRHLKREISGKLRGRCCGYCYC